MSEAAAKLKSITLQELPDGIDLYLSDGTKQTGPFHKQAIENQIQLLASAKEIFVWFQGCDGWLTLIQHGHSKTSPPPLPISGPPPTSLTLSDPMVGASRVQSVTKPTEGEIVNLPLWLPPSLVGFVLLLPLLFPSLYQTAIPFEEIIIFSAVREVFRRQAKGSIFPIWKFIVTPVLIMKMAAFFDRQAFSFAGWGILGGYFFEFSMVYLAGVLSGDIVRQSKTKLIVVGIISWFLSCSFFQLLSVEANAVLLLPTDDQMYRVHMLLGAIYNGLYWAASTVPFLMLLKIRPIKGLRP